jgi:hypothetical protein
MSPGWLIPLGLVGLVAALLTEVQIRSGRLDPEGIFPRRFQRLAVLYALVFIVMGIVRLSR